MALIKCSECGHQMSENAQVCPNCGNTNWEGVQKVQKKVQQELKKKTVKRLKWGCIVIIVEVLIMFIVFCILHAT